MKDFIFYDFMPKIGARCYFQPVFIHLFWRNFARFGAGGAGSRHYGY